MRRAAALLLCITASACRGAIAVPEAGDNQTLLMVVERQAEQFSIFASDPSAPFALPLGSDQLEGATIYALYYPCSLTRLGLGSGGPVSQQMDGRPLPSPAAGYALEAGKRSWSALGPLPDALKTIRIGITAPVEPTPCYTFTAEARTLPNSEAHSTRWVMSLDGSNLLAAVENYTFYRVTPSGAEILPELVDRGVPWEHAFRYPDGELILVGGSSTARGREVADLALLPGAPFPIADDVALDGTREAGADKELFASIRTSSNTGWVLRFDGSRWNAITAENQLQAEVDIARIGPNEVVALGLKKNAVQRIINGVASEEPVDVDDGDQLSTVRHLGAAGTIVASTRGYAWRKIGDRWERISNLWLMTNIDRLAPFKDGFLVGGHSSLLAQYEPSSGLCAAHGLGGGAVSELEPYGDGFLAVTSNFAAEMRPATVLLLHPTPPPAPKSSKCN